MQTESFYSASTLVTTKSIHDPTFDGVITYSQTNDGIPISGDIGIFAFGMRNPLGIGAYYGCLQLYSKTAEALTYLLTNTTITVLHSNGYLYGTDNGSNLGYVGVKRTFRFVFSSAA